MSVIGEQVQKLILNWLNEHYPTWQADWMEAKFDKYSRLPIEIKMTSAFYMLESNMINGGWAQVLWNCYGSWRQLIETAREGYELVGGAEEQLKALDQLYFHCNCNEQECELAISSEDGSMENFGRFTERSYVADGNRWEVLLWSGTNVYWKRLAWLEKNESRIKRLLDVSAPFDQ